MHHQHKPSHGAPQTKKCQHSPSCPHWRKAPCRFFMGPEGCTKGDGCGFVHSRDGAVDAKMQKLSIQDPKPAAKLIPIFCASCGCQVVRVFARPLEARGCEPPTFPAFRSRVRPPPKAPHPLGRLGVRGCLDARTRVRGAALWRRSWRLCAVSLSLPSLRSPHRWPVPPLEVGAGRRTERKLSGAHRSGI